MGQIIEHRGIIDEIVANRIQVLISQQTCCSECQAKEVCVPAENNQLFIEVENDHPAYKKGDKVVVFGEKTIGLQAILLAFVFPFILILSTLLILKPFDFNEVLSGSIALFVLVPYYVILSFFNKKIKARFKFDIRKEDEERNS